MLSRLVVQLSKRSLSTLPKNFSETFQKNGIAIVNGFLSEKQVEEMRRDVDDVVEKFDINAHRSVFDTYKQNHASKDDQFLASSDTVQYFLEKEALDENGNLTVSKERAINKIGHGLHIDRPTFKKNTFTSKAVEIGKTLGFSKPAVVQSMYIFKQPKIGDEVVAHQDATFLYVNPPDRLFGIWIALHDADRHNGCLWYVPGSHKHGIIDNTRFVRSKDEKTGDISLKFTGPWPMKTDDMHWEPAEVKSGDAVIIHGLVIHKR